MDRIDQLFNLLDRWRHLPAYQLERRADILFALYLPAFLSDHLGAVIRSEMIPEFPVRMGTIFPGTFQQNQNLSCKIDYVALAEDGTKIWFVELKTDAQSRRERQDDYLSAAQSIGMPALIEGVCKLFLKTTARTKSKYYHLLVLLESMNLLTLPSGFHAGVNTNWRCAAEQMSAVRISQQSPAISIVYLQPVASEPGEIGFETFAECVGLV